MEQSSGDPTRIDPYENYRFKVVWDGEYVAGVSNVGGLTQPGQVVGLGESPSPTDFEPITLEHGVTYDHAFEQWANQAWDFGKPARAGQESALAGSRKDIIIEMYDEAGQRVGAYSVYRCWVSEITSMPAEGAGNAAAIQSITLQNEGWDSV
jgi:phage tail-like protein